jgi:hypothetical protein
MSNLFNQNKLSEIKIKKFTSLSQIKEGHILEKHKRSSKFISDEIALKQRSHSITFNLYKHIQRQKQSRYSS